MKTIILALAISLTASSLAGQGSMKGMSAKQRKTAPAKTVQMKTIVVNEGFSPSTISVKAGQPLRITFDTKKKGCISDVVFEGMNLQKSLKDGTKTVVTLTPKKGVTNFRCPMKMMNGKIVAS